MRLKLRALSHGLLLLGAVLTGCNGSIAGPGGVGGGGGGDEDPPWEMPRFTCQAGQPAPELPLRRLSKQQLLNSVRDLVQATALTATEQAQVMTAVNPTLLGFPDDRLVGVAGEKHGGFTQLDQAIQQGQVDVTYAAALDVGRELTNTTSKVRHLLGACSFDSSTANDATCLRDFVARFGALAHRRPLDPADLDFYVEVASGTPVAPVAVADVVALLLTSPRFLYHVEEGDPAAAGPSALDAYALASRLSFHFWQTMPDAALRTAAADGTLATEAGYRTQVQRLFDDPRTDAALDDFFAHWFRLDELPPLNTRIGTPVFDAFAGADVPTDTLHEEMMAEVLDAARAVARGTGSVTEVMTSRRFYARTDALAALYGQPKWDGTSAPVDFAQPARAGLLTRAAFLATGSANTRPVMKGFRIRNALLCQNIPSPPANAMVTPIELAPDLTTRETVAAITEVPGSSCAGCHTTLLNPLGFATEDFDALGRHRTAQQLFNEQGLPTVSKPIDTHVVPQVAGVGTTIDDVTQLTQLLAQGGEFQTCFVRQYFRFTFQRLEDATADGCLLASLQSDALSGKPLRELLMATALAPEFQRRDFR